MALGEYKPSVSTQKGVENAAKIIEQWEEKENIKNNIYTTELDFNDYPVTARTQLMATKYKDSIREITGCDIEVRGVFVEAGKKPPLGQKRLHVYIKGNSRSEVISAYSELKKSLDETAFNYFTMGRSGYTGNTSKYQI